MLQDGIRSTIRQGRWLRAPQAPFLYHFPRTAMLLPSHTYFGATVQAARWVTGLRLRIYPAGQDQYWPPLRGSKNAPPGLDFLKLSRYFALDVVQTF